MRENEVWRQFEKGVPDLAQAYLDARDKLAEVEAKPRAESEADSEPAAERPVYTGDKATLQKFMDAEDPESLADEEIDSFEKYADMVRGVPGDSSGYEPQENYSDVYETMGKDYPTELEEGFKQVAADLRLTQDQYEGLREAWVDKDIAECNQRVIERQARAKEQEIAQAAIQEKQEHEVSILRAEHGESFDRDMRMTSQVATHFLGERVMNELEEAGYFGRADVVRGFYKIAREFQEDSFVSGDVAGARVTGPGQERGPWDGTYGEEMKDY
jgi:hypothetical protein